MGHPEWRRALALEPTVGRSTAASAFPFAVEKLQLDVKAAVSKFDHFLTYQAPILP
jgi:hypothetical protein